MDRRLLLVLNPCAGQKRANRFLPDIIRLYNNMGYECVVYVTACVGDATGYVRENAGRFDNIVCIGGDGTLNETIAGLVDSGVNAKLGYIPSGTTNDYARSLGLSTDVLKAADDAVNGELSVFDLGIFNNRHFTYTASCGAFAKASYNTSQVAKNLLGHIAYVLEGLKDLPSIRPIRMHIESDDRVLEGEYLMCTITNSTSVAGILKYKPELVGLDDGLFEVLLIKNIIDPIAWTRMLMALRASKPQDSDMLEFFSTSKIRIETQNEIEWTLDGERGEQGREFEIINHHRGIQLMLPVEHAALEDTEDKDDAEDQLSD